MIGKIKEITTAVVQEAVFHRRHLHQFPELSFQEYNTSEYIKQVLSSSGIDFEEVANTGVLARVQGQRSQDDATVILRADMDALPIQEENNSDFRSHNDGVMHACGHDFHTANLLTVLKVLKGMADSFSGTVIGIFQPAEEKIPGGAVGIIGSGKLPVQGANIRGVIGLHVSPRLQVGKVGIRLGKFMASSDELYITVKGKGGHGAQPHQNIDPVVIAAQLILSLQQIVSRFADPAIPSVLSFGKVIAQGATNVIPNEVYIEGTFRTMDETWRGEALRLIEKQIIGLPELYGATVDLEIRRGYPVLINDAELSQTVGGYIGEYISENQMEALGVWMAAEDFAYYTHRYPSLFYLVGVANKEKGIGSDLHTPTFQIDEDAFEVSIGTMVYGALRLLETNQ